MSAERSGFVCSRGCCGGCGDCYGYAIGCHRDPCRCAVPCTCRDVEGEYVGPCDRHFPERPEPDARHRMNDCYPVEAWEPKP